MVEGQGQEALKPFVRWLGGVSGWSEHCGLPLPGYFYLAYNLVGLFTFTEQEEEELRTAWQEGREHANRLLAQFPFSTCGNNEENLQPASELDRPARPSGRVNQQNKLEVRLGKRQLEVLRLLVEDHTHAEIAEKLVISRRTVDAHIRLIYDKLDVHSRAEARRWAKENKLIS
jgi:DNA-binding CsgD family transcriptional regulator